MRKNFKTKLTAKFLVALMVLQAVLFSVTAVGATAKVEPTSLSIIPVSINLFTTGTAAQKTNKPAVAWSTATDATYKEITWTTDNAAVATVGTDGLITGVAAGTATITATSVHNTTLKDTLTVNVSVPLTSVAYNPVKLTIKIGVTTSVYKPVLNPANATVTSITYVSSKPEVATVAADGTITTIKGGSTTITATITLPTGKKTATFAVTVPVPTTSVDIVKSQVNVNLIAGKKSSPIAFTVGPKSPAPAPTIKTVTWTIEDTSFATVDSKGVVTPIKVGSTKITAKSDYDNSIFETVALNVYTDLKSLTLTTKPPLVVMVGKKVNGPATKILPVEAASVNQVVYSVKQAKADVTAVSVDPSTGEITGLAPGKATITATVTAGDIIKKVSFTITVPTPATGITLDSKNKSEVLVDKTIKLMATVGPKEAGVKTYRFKSDNYAIASVNGKTGEVTGISAGTATITVTSDDGAFIKTTLITVKQ